MSRAIGTTEEVAEVLRHRLDEGLHRIAFFIVPPRRWPSWRWAM